jgi:hypothetical protein
MSIRAQWATFGSAALRGPIEPPELSIQHFYPPDMEWNADIIGIDRKEVRKPRMPPYTVRTHPIIPQACAPDKDGIRPERLASGRCENEWDGFPDASDAAVK